PPPPPPTPHTPPPAPLLRHPPAPPPPSPESQDAHAAPPPLLRARSGALESSPGHPPAPQTPGSHPCPISPGLQFDTNDSRPLRRGWQQIALPSALPRPDSPAPDLRPLYTAHRLHPLEPAPETDPAHNSVYSRWGGQSTPSRARRRLHPHNR